MEHSLADVPAALADFGRLLRCGKVEKSGDEESPAGAEVMIVVAHPDDETIGIGGHLSGLAKVKIIHTTDGAPRDLRDARARGFSSWKDYAGARRSELVAAMRKASIEADRLFGLGIADQQAARNLAPLALQLAGFFRDDKPDFVCTHPFEGGHPDHDATAFAVDAACRLIERAGSAPPSVIEMAFYHAGPGGPVYQDFAGDPAAVVLELALDGAALERKLSMLSCFATQRATLEPFDSTLERFRMPPRYDFLRPPNGGRLLYERLRLGLTGTEWVQLAGAAAEELGLAGQ
jgi:LmbE family N-acetylglucosaminyl deacetylase